MLDFVTLLERWNIELVLKPIHHIISYFQKLTTYFDDVSIFSVASEKIKSKFHNVVTFYPKITLQLLVNFWKEISAEKIVARITSFKLYYDCNLSEKYF